MGRRTVQIISKNDLKQEEEEDREDEGEGGDGEEKGKETQESEGQTDMQSRSSGSRLSVAGTRRCYCGLVDSPATLDNLNGTLRRPDLPSSSTLSVASSSAADSSHSEAFFAAGVKSKVRRVFSRFIYYIPDLNFQILKDFSYRQRGTN